MFDKIATALASAGVALAAVKLSGGALVSQGGGGASASANKAVVRKLYREVWNQKDASKAKAAAYQFISEDHILIDPSDPNPTPGVEAYMDMAESLRAAFSGNISLVVDDLIAQGLKVVAQISYKAEVGGRKARWTGTAVLEVEDGKIVKSWVNSDSLSALIQLGLLQDVMGDGEKTSPGQFERVTKRAAGLKTRDARGDQAENAAHLQSSELKVVQALLGRSEAHPTKVLTGNEWLQYFDKVASDDESDGEGFNQRMRVDSKTGLDRII
jgi:predicted SnoaL-like aldol condensation-catalyzing enzyme